MQYSDELIKQELTRYNTSNQPGKVSDDEVVRWKETFVNLDGRDVRVYFAYIHGRSWYWRKLMQSADNPANTTVDEAVEQFEAFKRLHPEVEIGIQVAMRQMGKPIEEPKAVEVVTEIQVEKIEKLEPEHKPKRRRKKKP